MYKKLTLVFAALLCSLSLLAQNLTGGVKGTVVNRVGRTPIAEAQVTVLQQGVVMASIEADQNGRFVIEGLNNGMYDLLVKAAGFVDVHVNVTVEGYVKDMMFLSMVAEQQVEEVDDSSFAEFDLDDSGYSDSPSIIFGSYDIFSNIAGFGFSPIRFKNRGYANETQDVYLSGVKMNDAITGYAPFSLWSGLNEAMRSKESTIGNAASDYGVGGFNGITNFHGNALSVRPGWSFSALTNSALYRLRLMATYASGQLDNGWSFAANVSARIGGNDWVKGVYYRSFAYYLAAEKKFNDQHRLSFSVFAAPGQRGAQNASTQEVYDLMGDNMYNSNWGYQNGKVRNSRVRKTHEPVFIVKYTADPLENLETNLTFLYRTGKNGYTALDWYDAPDPRPDYYRNLPSFFYMDEEGYGKNNYEKFAWAQEMWNPANTQYVNYQHVNWDRLYNVNYNSEDGRSKYIVEERRVDQNDLNLNADFKWRPKDWMTLVGGVGLKYNTTHFFKKVDDLLGGKYYLNIDQFAERDFAGDEIKIQNDLDYFEKHGEAQKLKKGDKYGYNYFANVVNAKVWAHYNYQKDGWDADAALEMGYDQFWRNGIYRKGLFPENSKGKSESARFFTARAKVAGGYTFKGGHRVYANVGFYNDAPTFSQSFVSPRTRNSLIPNLTTSKTLSADINYHWAANGYDIRLTGYWTKMWDMTDLMSFYDDTQHSFTNFAMTGMDIRHMGIELGFKIPFFAKGLSLQGVVAWGEHIYTSNPYMTQTIDNSEKVIFDNQQLPYWKSHPVEYRTVQVDGVEMPDLDINGNPIVAKSQKHYVPSTPQLATSLGFNYRTSSYWFFDLNGQFFANSYLDMNPLYRTEVAVAGPDGKATPAEIEYMAAQEKFKPVFLLNASIGKSWYINRKYNFGFSLNINNMTNNRNVKTGGYEQTRLIKSADTNRYYRFDPKYFYMQGINYMLNVYFRF